MENHQKNKYGLLFRLGLPLLTVFFAFAAGALWGWLPTLDKGIAEIIMYLTLMLVPLGFIFVFGCTAMGIFLKILRPYIWYVTIAIILFFVGMELSSQLPSIVMGVWYELANIIRQSDAY